MDDIRPLIMKTANLFVQTYLSETVTETLQITFSAFNGIPLEFLDSLNCTIVRRLRDLLSDLLSFWKTFIKTGWG